LTAVQRARLWFSSLQECSGLTFGSEQRVAQVDTAGRLATPGLRAWAPGARLAPVVTEALGALAGERAPSPAAGPARLGSAGSSGAPSAARGKGRPGLALLWRSQALAVWC